MVKVALIEFYGAKFIWYEEVPEFCLTDKSIKKVQFSDGLYFLLELSEEYIPTFVRQ